MRPHKKLIVWQRAISLVKIIYQTVNKFPESEKYGLISQLKRAAISVPANISEGAARSTQKEFLYFLHISSGSLSEVDTLLTISKELEMINESEMGLLEKELDDIASMLNGLIRKLKNNCKT